MESQIVERKCDICDKCKQCDTGRVGVVTFIGWLVITRGPCQRIDVCSTECLVKFTAAEAAREVHDA